MRVGIVHPPRIVEPDLFEAGIFSETEDRSLAKCRTGRSMRIYASPAIYIVKPDERRHWTSSTAQVDFRRILEDIRSGRVRVSQMTGALPARSRSEMLVLH